MAKRRAKRGRPPGGEYAGKSAVTTFRITPATKQLLEDAARVSGRTLSQEIEHQLRRALSGMGAGPSFALVSAVGQALDGLIRQRTPSPAAAWTEDPRAFDAVVRGFTAAIEMFRPPGGGVEEDSPEQVQVERLRSRAALLDLLAEIAAVPTAPLDKQSVRHRMLTTMKHDLGKLCARPALVATGDRTAHGHGPVDPERRLLMALPTKHGPVQAAHGPTDRERQLELLTAAIEEWRANTKENAS